MSPRRESSDTFTERRMRDGAPFENDHSLLTVRSEVVVVVAVDVDVELGKGTEEVRLKERKSPGLKEP